MKYQIAKYLISSILVFYSLLVYATDHCPMINEITQCIKDNKIDSACLPQDFTYKICTEGQPKLNTIDHLHRAIIVVYDRKGEDELVSSTYCKYSSRDSTNIIYLYSTINKYITTKDELRAKNWTRVPFVYPFEYQCQQTAADCRFPKQK